MKSFAILLLILLFALASRANNYYISAKGKDAFSGKTPVKSWKTIARLNQQKLMPGDSVLFCAGDVFSGEVSVNYSGTSNRPIVYAAYGKGTAPVISGSVFINHWLSFTGNILHAPAPKVYRLFMNGQRQTNARYPNQGMLKMDDGFNNKVSFTDNDLQQPDNYWVGATIRYRAADWEYRSSLITQFSQHNVTIKDSSSNHLEAGWGYYFDGKMSELDTAKEWFYDTVKQTLFFLPAQPNVVDNTIEATIFKTAFTIAKGVKHIAIANLFIRQFDKYGIYTTADNDDIKVTGNKLENVGLAGIFLDSMSTNCAIKNNSIYRVDGRGISALEPKHLQIVGNTIKAIGMITGYGISGVNGMIGIAIENIEKPKSSADHIALNNLISSNTVDSTGYVGIRMDGANSMMENNVVSNTLLYLSDGAAIYCWAKDGKNYTYDNVIRNNIVYNITGNATGTPSEANPIANGIYIDNNVYNIRIEGNTIFNSTGSGIHINSDAYNNSVTRNTVYNCEAGVSIAEWAKPNATFGNVIENNILFAVRQSQRCVSLYNWLLSSTKNLGSFNHNNYISMTEKYVFSESYLSSDHNTKILNEYSFEGWKKKYGFDAQSNLIGLDHPLARYKQSVIFFNETTAQKQIDVTDKDYYNLQGNAVKTLQLLPYTSSILLYK